LITRFEWRAAEGSASRMLRSPERKNVRYKQPPVCGVTIKAGADTPLNRRGPLSSRSRLRWRALNPATYELYSAENQEAWRRRYMRACASLGADANPQVQEGDRCALPRCRSGSRGGWTSTPVSAALTGFRAKAGERLHPAFMFLDCLPNREFPPRHDPTAATRGRLCPSPTVSTMWRARPRCIPTGFRETMLWSLGECAHQAGRKSCQEFAERGGQGSQDHPDHQGHGPLLWFTIEFGLMRSPGGVRVYGRRAAQLGRGVEIAWFSPKCGGARSTWSGW